MPWRYQGMDNKINVIVDPCFQGDLEGLALQRPVWIVDSESNRSLIDHAWEIGADQNLCEVSRCKVIGDQNDRIKNLLDIMGSLDDHYPEYELIVYGLSVDPVVTQLLGNEGFQVVEGFLAGFVALRIPGVQRKASTTGRTRHLPGELCHGIVATHVHAGNEAKE